MLAAFRRGAAQGPGGPAQGEGLAHQVDLPQFRVLHGLRHFQVLHLGIREDLVDGVNGAAGHSGLVEQRDQGLAGMRAGVFGQVGVDGVTVLRPGRGVGIAGLLQQHFRADGLGEALPDHLARRGDVDVPIGGGEDARGNGGGMVVTGLGRHLLVHQPARGLEVQHEDLRSQQGSLHPLSFAGNLALQQGGENAHGAEQPGGQVGDGNARAHRALARQSGDGHQPAHALGDLVEAGAFPVGAVLAEAGDAPIHQPRVDRPQGFVIHAQPVLDVRAVVLYHHVGLFHQPLEQRQSLCLFQVEGDAALVAVQVLEIGPMARPPQGGVAFHRGGGFHLDHVGPPVRQLAHAGGPGPHPGQVQHGETGKGEGAVGCGHGGFLYSSLDGFIKIQVVMRFRGEPLPHTAYAVSPLPVHVEGCLPMMYRGRISSIPTRKEGKLLHSRMVK